MSKKKKKIATVPQCQRYRDRSAKSIQLNFDHAKRSSLSLDCVSGRACGRVGHTGSSKLIVRNTLLILPLVVSVGVVRDYTRPLDLAQR
jgi:hypothetical protein